MDSKKPRTVEEGHSAFHEHAHRILKTSTSVTRTRRTTTSPSPPSLARSEVFIDTSSDLPDVVGAIARFDELRGASPVTGEPSSSVLSSISGMTADEPIDVDGYSSADLDGFETDDDDDDDDDTATPGLPIRNGVYWDYNLNCEARPISKPCLETVDPGVLGIPSKCICGQPFGGKRVSISHPKEYEYKGPRFVFDEKKGCYHALETPTLYTPFHHFKVDDKDIFQPVSISKDDYLAGACGPRLSLERSVPMCAHFPITGLGAYNVPFVKGRIAHRMPNSQCIASRVQDQARMLCLIEDEVRYDGTVRRRMNIHAPPADWNDGAAISALNRWRSQFRQRKLGITSRPARYKWSEDALNYIIERLARDPSEYRALLARDVSRRFEIERTEHAVSCAIDHHKLRLSADALRSRWDDESLSDMLGDGGDDLDVEDFEEFEFHVKDEETPSSDFDREGALRKVKMEDWAL